MDVTTPPPSFGIASNISSVDDRAHRDKRRGVRSGSDGAGTETRASSEWYFYAVSLYLYFYLYLYLSQAQGI
jgi:hypothetical protein